MMHVVFLQLDPIAPWITEHRPVTPSKLETLRSDPDQMNLRSRWTSFVDAAADAFRANGWRVEQQTVDRWAINADLIDTHDADIVFVPHSTRKQLGPTKTPVFFYMQVMQRWLFTADANGWGAASSRYPCKAYTNGDPESDVWEKYRARLVQNNESKFTQTPATSRSQLMASGMIPDAPFIFFPCQIPHDESLTLFSPLAEIDLVASLSAWARTRKISVVFKEHPANRRAMRPLREAAGAEAFWSEASVHDLIREANAVYTLNSGVGFEALVHETPLVAFAKAEYDVVAEIGELPKLDDAWASCLSWDRGREMIERRRFIDWYCRSYAIDLDAGTEILRRRLSALVKEAEGLCRAKTPERE